MEKESKFKWKHKKASGNKPFIFMTFEESDVDRLLNDLIKTDEITFTCNYCNDILDRESIGGIMPSKTDKPIYLCRSILCMEEYFEDYMEEIEEEK